MTIFLNIYRSTLIMAAPLILASLGGLVSYHAGITNIAMEGLILASAFTAVTFSYMSGSALAGVLMAVVAAVLIALIHGIFVIILKCDNFAIGIAVNIFISSFTLFLTRILFVGQDAFNSPDIKAIWTLKVNLGNSVLNSLFSNFSILVYLMFVLPFVFSFIIYKTPLGLWFRAAGEFPDALAAAGKNVWGIQLLACAITGMMCALAGAQLSLSNVVMFSRDMSAGRGFICFAVILISKGRPKMAFFLAVLFGFCEALSIQLQGIGIPAQFLYMIPYISAIISLLLIVRSSKRAVVGSAS